MQTKNNKRLTFSVHSLSLLSIEVYIILSTIFETMQSNLSRISSYSLYFCVVFCLIDVVLSKKMKIDWFGVLLIVFSIILSVSYFWSPTNVFIKNTYLYRSISTYIVIILIGNILKNINDVEKILNTIICAGVLLSIQIYLKFGLATLAYSGIRMGNEMGNQNLLGWYCSCAILISIFRCFTNENKTRFLYLIPAIICVPAVMFSGSRKAILVLLISILVFMLFYSEKNTFFKRLVVGLLIVIGFIYIIENVPAFSVINERFKELTSIFHGGESHLQGDLNRISYIREGLKAFADSPIVGKGFCYSYYLLGAYTHNNYVELLLNHGIVGFLIYYFAFVKILVNNKSIRSINKRMFAFIVMVIVAVLVCDIGVVSYYNRFTLVLVLITEKTITILNNKLGSKVMNND